MKNRLEQLFQHQTFTQEEAKSLLMDLVYSNHSNSQIAACITAFNMRKITIEELAGFRDALLECATTVDLSEFNPMDVCGTGGDGKNTFNISTLTAFTVAGAGINVAKHGNYAASSVSGSSNVLDYLGINFTSNIDQLKKQLDQAGICFMHAPLFHPALKKVAPIRKELGVKTFFNMLGPLVHPAQPKIQLAGVFNLELARMYQYLLERNVELNFSIVHSLDGCDELSLIQPAKVFNRTSERWLAAKDFGYSAITETDLYGGQSIADAATLFMRVLNGEGTVAQNQVVLANSAIAIQTYLPLLNIQQALELAENSLLQGNALKKFNHLKTLS